MLLANKYSLDGKIQSEFFKGELIYTEDFSTDSSRLEGVKRWSKLINEEQIKKGISYIPNSRKTFNNFKSKDIAYKFSKLKTENDINEFANDYGLLGIKPPSYQDIELEGHLRDLLGDHPLFKNNPPFGGNISYNNGTSQFEPIQLWEYHINLVRKVLRLYKCLTDIHTGKKTVEDCELFNIGDPFEDEGGIKYIVEWPDGEMSPILADAKDIENENYIEIARQLLISVISKQIEKGINNIALEIIKTDKNPIGFYVQESKTTETLINVIYYELWNLISNNEPIYICENPKCQLPIPKKTKRSKYCNASCKQEAYRIRKGIARL